MMVIHGMHVYGSVAGHACMGVRCLCLASCTLDGKSD
jgi:hypothetical protein